MFQFTGRGSRGGVSNITHRHGKANNKYMSSYDSKEPSKYIMYLDANNLYGWAMSQYLRTGGFRWLTKKEVNKLDSVAIGYYGESNPKGLVLEVDLEYPKELHDKHNSYPLAPEKTLIKGEVMSPYARRIMEKFNIASGVVSKLVTTLNDKVRYVVHYRNLQLHEGTSSARVRPVTMVRTVYRLQHCEENSS